jgi:subtilisin family serine protease
VRVYQFRHIRADGQCSPVKPGGVRTRTMSGLSRVALLPVVIGSLALFATAGATARTAPRGARGGDLVEVVVTLPQPPLSEAILHDRGLAAAATVRHKVNVRAPASVAYLRTLAAAQRQLQARVTRVIPQARVRWHYGVVLDGVAVVVPRSRLGRLEALKGMTVWPTVTYHELLDRSPQLIGAPTVWGPTLATAGQGIKIGIIDDGVDQTHVFFSPTGFSYPAGFPKGNTAYTTPKVIVARAFAPAEPVWKYANTPFDPQNSDHATNVAGIAAGDHGTIANVQGNNVAVSGIAPEAYLGNYKVLTIPTEEFGLDGNSPEIAAGIEQAVKDGMDVINLSLGEPEVEPTRDVVVQAIDDAADAGVVPVIAAGNDNTDAGRGSVGSPGTAPKAITVAASTENFGGPADEIADFSSSGPTPITLQMKPDVTAPGVDILSSLPHNSWSPHDWSGTSMATPHVAGAAALLKERHPTWTVEQIKSALESTGDPVHVAGTTTEVLPLREGGGRIDLPNADNPLVFTDPTGLSFGLVKRGDTVTQQLAVTDAGGGPDPWTVTIEPHAATTGAALAPTAPTVVPGTSVGFTLTVAADAAEGDSTGFVILSRGTDVRRRIPYWLHVEVPKLGGEPHTTITRPGVYHGDTAGKPSLVSTYRYPEGGLGAGIAVNLSGPEQVFRFTVTQTVANFGAVVTGHAAGVTVTPRLVSAGDENRLVGYTGLPVDINPYASFGNADPVVGDVLPGKGDYDLVFDTPAGGKPGPFSFRFWVNDSTPPTVKLLQRTVRRGQALRLAVHDSGSGIAPASIFTSVDGIHVVHTYAAGVVTLGRAARKTGTHALTVTVADFQETKNMEDVGPILPNTRTFRTHFTVRP